MPFFSGCHSTENASAPPPSSNAPLQVKLTPLQVRGIGLKVESVNPVLLTEQVECNGEIEAADALTTHIFSPAPGRIYQISGILGQFVQSGQLLATLKSDEIGKLESELLQQTIETQSDLKQMKAQLELSKATYEREQELFKEEVSAKSDFQAARTQYRKDMMARDALVQKSAANIQSLRDRFALYGVSQETISQVIRNRRIYPYLSIVAPRSGIITERTVNQGEMVEASKPLFTVTDLSQVWLVGELYEKDISAIKLGQRVDVKVDSLPSVHFQGKVDFISNLLDPQNRTLKVRGVLPNINFQLKPNMFARMVIKVGQHRALAVPKSAIQSIGDSLIVYVAVEPNTFEERTVRVGNADGNAVEILSGLKQGESVAVTGTVNLKGMIIKKRGEISAGGTGS